MIDNQPQIDETQLFAQYAKDDFQKWKEIVGWEIKHNCFGIGKVSKVVVSNYGEIFITVHFCSPPAEEEENKFKFLSTSFQQGLFTSSSNLSEINTDWEDYLSYLVTQQEREKQKREEKIK